MCGQGLATSEWCQEHRGRESGCTGMGRRECEGSRGEATGGGKAADGGGVKGEERRLTGDEEGLVE